MEVELNDKNFKEEVLDSQIPVLVDFWAAWCAPCSMIAPLVQQTAEEYQGKLKVCKLNVDTAPETASEYDVMSIPTLAVFKKGKLVERVVGVVPPDELAAAIKPHI
ncbi:thioredoxin [Candidatus Omnitrophota bacterium]